jgi:uncharacterized protein (TIGR01777 family)
MKILITGATGLVGKELGKKLVSQGHQIVAVTRNIELAKQELPYPAKLISWNYETSDFPIVALEGVDAVVHLMGESVGGSRWSSSRKAKILNSRKMATEKLAKALKQSTVKTVVSASAVGVYGHRGQEVLTEESSKGSGMLAEVCAAWEGPIYELNKTQHSLRTVIVRIGIVLARDGGALKEMIPLFAKGVGSPIGDGQQIMSWIHLHDLVEMISFSISNDTIKGVYNAVAPTPVSNKVFSEQLSNAFGGKCLVSVPAFVIKLALGEMSALVLDSINVSNQKILKTGFQFQYPDISAALSNLIDPIKSGEKILICEQWVPATIDKVFPFFCDEKNLETLTPPFLEFKVLKKSTPSIQKGTLIDYKLKLHGISFYWRTLIEDWSPGKFFIDTQMKGPYKKWHHTHEFIPSNGGTLLRDVVQYQLPMGKLGDLVALKKVEGDVQTIFKYRRKVIADLFYNQGA